jgi:hypothetical protein
MHERFDPLGEAFLRDPYAVMAELPPVFYAPSIDYYAVPFHPNISFRGPQVLWVHG